MEQRTFSSDEVAAEEKSAAADVLRRQLEAAQIIRDFHDTFKSIPGQSVMRYLRKTFYDVQSFVPQHGDGTAFNEGSRAVVAAMLEIVERPIPQVEPEGGVQ